MSQQIGGKGGNLVFPIGTKNTNLVEDIEILLPVKFCWIPFSSFRGEVENASANQRSGGHLVFPIGLKKKFGRVHDWDLASCQVSFNSLQRRSWKCLSQSEARWSSCFSHRPEKNTNLVEDIEISIPVKFHWIPFSSFRGEVENVSANQRPGRPSCFSNRPEKHKHCRGHYDLASCQVFPSKNINCLTDDGRKTDNP